MDYKKAQKSLEPLLGPASSLYSGLMGLRAKAYARGLKKSQKPRAFCVSVGNIAWGGSGKTPLADWLLGWAKSRGLSPGLLTRGYGGESEERPLLVKPWTAPEQSGDEALMLARRHPDVYILADPKRRRALDWLEAHTTSNFVILDDGMQHLAVARNLNLVLLRACDLLPEFWNKLIPAGEWREGAEALHRASAFLLRMSPALFEQNRGLISQRLAALNKPLFSFDLAPTGLMPLGKNEAEAGGPHKDLGGRPYALCTGVGNPAAVAQSAMELLGAGPEKEFIYPDHHRFSIEDIRQISKARLPVVTTGKDAVKLQSLHAENHAEFWVLESEVRFGQSMFTDAGFPAWLEAFWQEHS